MTAAAWQDGFRLARPAQWPILTAQFLLSVVLAAPPLGAGFVAWWRALDPVTLAGGWLAWVVLLNGGTLAFNSAYDRDTGPVAYLAQPPQPPAGLAGWALGAMLLGAGVGRVAVGPLFGGITLACVVLSVLYSHPSVRLKGRPGWDLAVNVAGYGAATTLAGLVLGGGGAPAPAGWWFTAGFGLLFGSFYPLTQIYQADADRARGDRTLATALGTARSLDLALILGAAACAAFGLGLAAAGRGRLAGVAGIAGAAWLGHLLAWRIRGGAWTADRHERGMYRALVLWALVDVGVGVAWLGG